MQDHRRDVCDLPVSKVECGIRRASRRTQEARTKTGTGQTPLAGAFATGAAGRN